LKYGDDLAARLERPSSLPLHLYALSKRTALSAYHRTLPRIEEITHLVRRFSEPEFDGIAATFSDDKPKKSFVSPMHKALDEFKSSIYCAEGRERYMHTINACMRWQDFCLMCNPGGMGDAPGLCEINPTRGA
jgi:hypothetical protein